MYVDIVKLVRDALLYSGVDKFILSDFDGHSTIALDFENYPSLLISNVDEQIWIWSQLSENTPGLLQHKSAQIQEKIMEGCHFAMTGQLQIAINNDTIELKGLVHPYYLTDGACFADAMDEFFQLQEAFLGVIR
ncbi:type III secretion system chaperone SpaK [Candidatus Symbiopectobacterium sp. 'North America']|uniref:InvB/SpaK family type III secretion system chaperone n=1 Tax=Candidatus Symbiopectobacterium sp. 'North America' TaxID=2794574 RepID=UPI0018CAAD0C|nr:SPI-1 type III secretion system chaperone SpaK [Candidatus Symbiopectobacterium sp. 'North America']MBG6245649.1 type III secretion system chaperone SpaK [Candidatus Symbiopectobacterium sp. 'North America']